MDKWVWLDLEMTGLQPQTDCVLEIAVVITDSSLQWVLEGPNLVIHQPNGVLDRMNDWCKAHHGASGLTAAVQQSQITCKDAEKQVLDFLSQYVEAGASPLCGNSIGTDRKFLEQHMPTLASFFHYRNFDVSSFKIAQTMWSQDIPAFEKPTGEQHRAMFDVHQSIEEARYYKQHCWQSAS